MLTWLSELFRPSRKCARIGHKPRTRRYQVFTRSAGYRAVADSGVLTREECRRCHSVLTEGEISKRSSIQSLSMPEPMWDALRANGFVIRREL